MEATQERKSYGGYIENRVRFTIEMEEELRRELRLEATRRGISLREYVTAILEEGHRERVGGDT